MMLWNDMDPEAKLKIYDKGIMISHIEEEERKRLLVSCRTGNMFAPEIDRTEALSIMIKEFVDCINQNRSSLTDGEAGLRVLRFLETTERSIKADGANVRIEY